jgi:hypothetical protein
MKWKKKKRKGRIKKMPIDYEPGPMWLHRGELGVAQEVVRKLKGMYEETVFGSMMRDLFTMMLEADTELAAMTERKNKLMYDELSQHLEAGVDDDNFKR